MLFRQITRGNPERIYVSVRNCSGVTLRVGVAPVFEYIVTTYQDGFNVTLCTTNRVPGLLAGIVATHSIEPGGFGICQCYGHVDSMIMCGDPALGNDNPLSGYNTTSIATIQLYPIESVTTTAGYNRAGALSAVAATSYTSIRELQARVWLGTLYSNGETVNTHPSGHETVIVKGFIRAM